MVRATLRMRVRPGSGAEFEAAWREIARAVSGNPANLGQALLRDGEPDAYLITSDWATREDFTAFERSPEQDRLTEPLRRVRVSGEMCVHELVHRVAPEQ
jgi:heme-degrading monooxygenase HmoA